MTHEVFNRLRDAYTTGVTKPLAWRRSQLNALRRMIHLIVGERNAMRLRKIADNFACRFQMIRYRIGSGFDSIFPQKLIKFSILVSHGLFSDIGNVFGQAVDFLGFTHMIGLILLCNLVGYLLELLYGGKFVKFRCAVLHQCAGCARSCTRMSFIRHIQTFFDNVILCRSRLVLVQLVLQTALHFLHGCKIIRVPVVFGLQFVHDLRGRCNFVPRILLNGNFKVGYRIVSGLPEGIQLVSLLPKAQSGKVFRRNQPERRRSLCSWIEIRNLCPVVIPQHIGPDAVLGHYPACSIPQITAICGGLCQGRIIQPKALSRDSTRRFGIALFNQAVTVGKGRIVVHLRQRVQLSLRPFMKSSISFRFCHSICNLIYI